MWLGAFRAVDRHRRAMSIPLVSTGAAVRTPPEATLFLPPIHAPTARVSAPAFLRRRECQIRTPTTTLKITRAAGTGRCRRARATGRCRARRRIRWRTRTGRMRAGREPFEHGDGDE